MKRGSKWGAKARRNLLDEAEVERLKAACETPLERLVVFGLLYTGMRESEFIHMDRGWVDWESGFIRIPERQRCTLHYECRRARYRTDRRTGRRVESKPPGVWRVKVPEAERSIPILPEVRGVFEEYFRSRRSVGEAVPHRVAAWGVVRGVARRAGLGKRVFPHGLRGTFASMLAGKEFPPDAIREIMGWKSVLSADEYIRLSPQRLRTLVEKRW
jgi:integrase/recombinase XerD